MSPSHRNLNSRFPGLWHGGDYNPEQWSAETWKEDLLLMEESKFRVATLGVFSWVSLEPSEGNYAFEWLDEIVAGLERIQGWFILATPSAAPPAWMSKKYPEILRTGPDRVRRLHGNRVNYNLSSPIYREKTREMARQLAERYGNHPRLLAWHVSNEFGGEDYGSESISEFRDWLKKRYGSLEALNAAYWTAFWGHTFTDWEEIDAPGAPFGETAIQALTVDWQRFVTDQTIAFMENEAAPLREIAPHVPVTTNFMGTYPGLDYRKFSSHLDFSCWDSYPGFGHALTDSRAWVDAGFKHDLTRCLTPGRKWMMMECSPSSSNWYPSMALKKPGMHRFEALQAVAHGADGVQYFQWRQSRGGQEQLHGAVVGHSGGSSSRVFKDVARVGSDLENLEEVAGSSVKAEVAVMYDWEVRWALDAACGPVQKNKGYEQTCIDYYQVFWEAGLSVDVIGMDDSLDGYKVLVAPMAYSLRPGFVEKIEQFVKRGGRFVTTYLTGWTDENSLVFKGGFLAPLKSVLGIWSEEIDALPLGGQNQVRINGLGIDDQFEVTDFCELIHLGSATILGTYENDFYAGRPAFTVNPLGAGFAYYIASRNEMRFTREVLGAILREVGLESDLKSRQEGVTLQTRHGSDSEWMFFLNATPSLASVASEEFGEIEIEPWGVEVRRKFLA